MDTRTNYIVQQYYRDASNIFGDKLKSVILYGSCARGDNDTESDIDLMVLLDIPREEIYKARKDMRSTADKLDLENDCVISAVFQSYQFYEDNKSVLPFYRNIEAEGIALE